ncbi:PREDICTED: F-box/kelch-repeat protein At3g06240-like isoform 2 [Fragaria vesca subsp. vesca]
MEFTVHIFSTRDSSWKDIRFPHSSFPCGDDGKVLLVSNGAIHWVCTGIPEAISAFDLVSEEFRQLPLPRGLNGRRIWTQVLVGGHLCVRSHDEFWVMKEYRVPESWVKMFQFSVVDLPNVFGLVDGWVPAFVTEGSTVVMLHGKELARIKCHREGKPVYMYWPV